MLKGIDRFEGRSSLKTWIFHILANTAKTRAQREGRSIPFSALEDPARVPEAAVGPDRFLDQSHDRWPGHWGVGAVELGRAPRGAAARQGDARVRGARDRALPPTQRAVISLRDVEGWDSEEVCNVLGVTETNQRVLLHRARSRVRGELETYVAEELA